MGNSVSYSCDVKDRAICLSYVKWIKEEWVTALWIVWTVFWGCFMTVAFYMGYLTILEILRSLPFEYIEYLGGDVEYEEMLWPPLFGVDSEDSFSE